MLQANKKEYFPGIDLLKLISMFFILILHILGQGGVLNATKPTELNYWIAWLLEICAYCAVNCFAMATGYLMEGRKFRYRRIIPLWIIVVFYTALFLIIGKIYWEDAVSSWDWSFLLPVTSSAYWYFTAYFFLFFFIPFLNKLIENLSRRECIILLLTGFLLICGSRTIGIYNQDAFKTSGGYSALWLIYMYLLGAGIKKHKFFEKLSAIAALFGYIMSVLVTWATQYLFYYILQNIPKEASFYIALNKYGFKHFISYISPTIVCAGVFLMLFCLKLRLPKFLHYPLKWTAPLIFQVYIIHLHCVVWDKIITKRYVEFAKLPAGEMVLKVLGTALLLLLICLGIDCIRYWLFRLLHIDPLINLIADKINAAYHKRIEARKEKKLDKASKSPNKQ